MAKPIYSMMEKRNKIINTTIDRDMDDEQYILWIYREFKTLMFYTAKQFIQEQATCEDIIQDSIVRLIEKVDTLRGKEMYLLAGYIVSTVRNAAINYLKHSDRNSQFLTDIEEEDWDDIPAKEPSMDDMLIAKERASLLSEVLERLPPEDRLLLEGKYILGYSNEMLSQQAGCKPDSIRMKLTRARRNALLLLRQMEKEGEDWS